MQVSFFLGAGASAPYGMPTAGEFMELLRSRGRNSCMWRAVIDVLGASSIEGLFDGLADTAGYFSTGAGRSVRSWLLKSAPGGPTQWMRDIPGLEADLRGRILEAYGWNPEMRAVLRAVLEPLLDLAAGQKEIPVYTTNYDRCVEEYCSNPNRGLLCRDGFQADSFVGRFRWSDTYGPAGEEEGGLGAPRPLKLHKLHGSLGWKLGPYGPERLAYESRSDSSHRRDLLAYPSSRANPLMENALFRTILSEFEKSLLSSDACVVIGYSFRDSGIADAFKEFVRGDRILVVVGDGAVPDIYRNVLRVPVPEGADRRWRRAGPGRVVCIDPSLPNVYGVNELVSPETILGITRSIGGILHGNGAAAAGPWTSAACASAAGGHGGAPPRGGSSDALWQPLVAGPGRP